MKEAPQPTNWERRSNNPSELRKLTALLHFVRGELVRVKSERAELLAKRGEAFHMALVESGRKACVAAGYRKERDELATQLDEVTSELASYRGLHLNQYRTIAELQGDVDNLQHELEVAQNKSAVYQRVVAGLLRDVDTAERSLISKVMNHD